MSNGGLRESNVPETVPPEWQRWIAENILLRKDVNLLVEAMVQNGFERDAAARAVQAALTHPYVVAAQAVVVGAAAATDNRLKKRDWVLEIYRRTARLASAFGRVPRVRKPSRSEFLDRYYARNEPVLIEGVANDWPALTRWTPAYFKQRLGQRIVEVQAHRHRDADYEINKDKLRADMRFGDYVDLVEAIGSSNDYYITAKNAGKNADSLRELWDDIPPCPEYLRNDAKEHGFFWYGPQGTVTPLHHDLTNNFMAQIRGRKLVRLIAPYELADVYNHFHCYAQVDLDRIDYNRFPRFRNVRILDLVLEPGDLFFLPVGWWHYVRALDVSITMTFTHFAFDNDFYSFYTTYQHI
jgi:hypothetical protein